MQVIEWACLSPAEKRTCLARPRFEQANVASTVRDVLDAVRHEGDIALKTFTERFDGVRLSDLRVECSLWEDAFDGLNEETKLAMRRAASNIEAFHTAQKPVPVRVEVEPGLVCERLPRPLRQVGIYVPGGSAPLFSSLLMAAVPARCAGVERVFVVTPPQPDGHIHPTILAAAHLCGVTDLFSVGGAQAIAALAYGTDTIPRADKIFGPGNIWVASAKQMVAAEIGGPAIDLPAGPSEVMVVADEQANPAFVASDLLSQAEHDPLAQVILVAPEQRTAAEVATFVNEQVRQLPRQKIALESLKNSKTIIADRDSWTSVINMYAPEHLILQIDEPSRLLPQIDAAGSIFLGPWTPEAVGDYASGTNHVLPTAGAARSYSGLGIESFYTFMTVQALTRDAFKSIGPTVNALAQLEELDAHAKAISIRMESDR